MDRTTRNARRTSDRVATNRNARPKTARPRLRKVEFDFGRYSVFFDGGFVKVYDDSGVLAEGANPWTGNGRPNEEIITCREFKPRIKDALTILNSYIAGDKPFPKQKRGGE